MALTALRVAKAKPGTHSDDNGLLLLVRPSGARSWILRIQHDGRRRDFGLGSFDWVSLADARAAAAALRAGIKRGEEPIGRETRRERRAKSIVIPTFESVARDCYEALKDGWNDKRKKTWLASLETHIFPTMGKKAVDLVDSAMVRDALEPIWLKISPAPPATARSISPIWTRPRSIAMQRSTASRPAMVRWR